MHALLILALSSLRQVPDGSVREALAAGDFRAAWSAASDEDDAAARARARAEVLYTAGDPAGALAEAKAGLAEAPLDLELLFYASSAAIWLGDAPTAQATAGELAAAVRTAELAEADREVWRATAERHVERAAEIAAREADRSAALVRARVLALVALAAALGLAARSAVMVGRSGA